MRSTDANKMQKIDRLVTNDTNNNEECRGVMHIIAAKKCHYNEQDSGFAKGLPESSVFSWEGANYNLSNVESYNGGKVLIITLECKHSSYHLLLASRRSAVWSFQIKFTIQIDHRFQ